MDQDTAESEKIKKDAEQAADYKARYKVHYKIVCEDEAGNEKTAWLKNPSRMAVGIHLGKYEQNPVEACEIILNDAMVREISDWEYFQRNDVIYGIVFKIQAIVQVKKSTLITL